MIWLLRLAGWVLIVIGSVTSGGTGRDIFALGVIAVLAALTFGRQEQERGGR